MTLMNPTRIKLGNLLVTSQLITAAQLQDAIKIQKEQGGKLGDILIKQGLLNEKNLATVLSEQLNLPFVDLKQYTIKPDVMLKLSERFARRFHAIVLKIEAGAYCIGMTDPTDVVAYDELSRVLGSKLSLAVVLKSDLLPIFDLVYRRTQNIALLTSAPKEEIVKKQFKISATVEYTSENPPLSKLLDSIFADAVQMRASDIHIEAGEKGIRIRQRIDGVLYENMLGGSEIISALELWYKIIFDHSSTALIK